MNKNNIEQFHQHLNTITHSIKFTKEIEDQGTITFLDVQITRQNDGSLETNVHRKPTHTNRYLNYSSHHPLSQKLSVPKTLYNRANNLITNTAHRQKENKQIYHALKLNGFPKSLATRHSYFHKKYSNRSTTNNKNYTSFTSIPYIQGVSEPVMRALNRVGVRVAMKPFRTISNILSLPKDRTPVFNKPGVVYEIPCRDCNAVYIGQTERNVNTRLKEHKRAVKNMDAEKSALCAHMLDADHHINWNETKILKCETNYYQRTTAESCFINIKSKDKVVLNRNDGNFLPKTYKSLL